MKTIINYAIDEKRSFREYPFNEVDSLVLSTIAYFNFDKDIPSLFSNGKKQLKDITIKESYVSSLGDKNQYIKLLENAINNPRFNELYLDNYYDKEIKEEEIQFRALTFENKDFMYISYMGTKIDCLYSWKEDFKLSYLKQVPAQKYALKYLNKVMLSTLKPIYVGGHSKGGNLAIYASMNTFLLNKLRIKKIFSHDGPGFIKEIFESNKYKSIKNKIYKTVPSTAIVGMFFNNDDDYKVVKAAHQGFRQHSPINWGVKNSAFAILKDRSRLSKFIDKRFTTWVDNLTDEQKINFTNCLFEALEKGGFDSMDIANRNYMSMIKAVRKGLNNVDKETRELIVEIFKRLIAFKQEILNDNIE